MDELAGHAAFYEAYAAALRLHVDDPKEQGLVQAAEFGQAARRRDLSMLQLVGLHLEVRRALVLERGIDRLADMDAFLSSALGAHDSEVADAEGPISANRDRLDWLRGLSDAYIAIASGATLEARTAEVCVQARKFLGAADARLEFGRRREAVQPSVEGDEMSAHLLGSAGLLTVTSFPGQRWSDAERAALQQLAALISAPINDARRLEFAESAGQLAVLLGGVADPDGVLERFRSEGVAQLGAARAIVRLFDGNGDRVPGPVEAAIDEVARRGTIVLVDEPGDGGHDRWAVVPLGSGGGRIGVLAVEFDEPQPFDEVQQSFLADIAQRLSAALERSRAYANERASRHDAELASARLRDLQALATDLARAATRRRVAQVLLRRAVVSAGAVGGFVAIFTSYPETDVLAVTGTFRSEHWSDVSSLVAEMLPDAARRNRRGELPVMATADIRGAAGQQLTADGLAQLTWQPITSGEREIGILVIGWNDRVEAREVDRALLQAQVAMAGSTLQRAARYDVEHAIADTLQRSMLALPPLAPEGVRWSVLYRAGSAGLAGGDWYDLIEIDKHRLAIAVGDIVGRGVEAAASMGQVRSATRALATHIDDPAALLEALDQYARNTGQGHYSSLAYVVLDVEAERIAYSLAGHLPPVLRLPDGSVTTLAEGRGPLLGMRCDRVAATHRIVPGTRIVIYTDGLVDRRGESVDVGLDRLVAAVRASSRDCDPDEACRDLVDRLLGSGAQLGDVRDDVAVVVVELKD